MTISTTKKLLGATGRRGRHLRARRLRSGTDRQARGLEKPVDSPTSFPASSPTRAGWNDKSFNQSAKEGMDSAADELGIKPLEFESANDNDYAPNLETAVSEGCSLIVAVGFKLSAATVESALANPEIDYAIIDDYADNDFDGTTDAPNIKPLVFDTAQAAYLGGYAAAAWSAQSGVNKVGSFGGMQIPVGRRVHGRLPARSRQVQRGQVGCGRGLRLGRPRRRRARSRAASTRTTPPSRPHRGVLDQGVDVILPVGGPVYQSAAAAITDSGKDTLMLGVDSDLAVATRTWPA